MAEKQDYLQPELFTADNVNGQLKPQINKDAFFMRIRGYEKIMLLIMGLILVGIVAYSLGVQRGKGLILASSFQSSTNTYYTIQVAAFKNRQLAVREVQMLVRRGLSPLAFAKGDYIILCVGKFSNQESAQPLLIQLQKSYAGCRIRRL